MNETAVQKPLHSAHSQHIGLWKRWHDLPLLSVTRTIVCGLTLCAALVCTHTPRTEGLRRPNRLRPWRLQTWVSPVTMSIRSETRRPRRRTWTTTTPFGGKKDDGLGDTASNTVGSNDMSATPVSQKKDRMDDMGVGLGVIAPCLQGSPQGPPMADNTAQAAAAAAAVANILGPSGAVDDALDTIKSPFPLSGRRGRARGQGSEGRRRGQDLDGRG